LVSQTTLAKIEVLFKSKWSQGDTNRTRNRVFKRISRFLYQKVTGPSLSQTIVTNKCHSDLQFVTVYGERMISIGRFKSQVRIAQPLVIIPSMALPGHEMFGIGWPLVLEKFFRPIVGP
jgi:hypothetical protein